jgi:hypothetical protein
MIQCPHSANVLFQPAFQPVFLDSPLSRSIKHASARALLGADCFCVGRNVGHNRKDLNP